MKPRIAGLALGLMSFALWSGQALAMSGEWAAGGELGVGRSTRSSWSPSVGLRGAYGLAEALELQLEVSGQWLRPEHSFSSSDSALLRFVPAVAYKLDVVRLIPFVRLGAGPVFAVPLEGEEPSRAGLDVQGSLGADYLIDRSVSVGFAYQADWVFGAGELTRGLEPMHRLVLSVMWRSGW